MIRVLIVTFDAGGNVPPAIGIGQRLADDGDDVLVLGGPSQRAVMDSAGLPFEPFDAEPPYRPTRAVNLLTNLRQVTSTLASRAIGRDVVAVAARTRPDVVLVDTMLLSAVHASVAAGLPTVTLVHTLPSFFARSYARGPVGAAAALRGFRMGRTWGTATATLATVLPGLDLASERDPRPWPDLRFVGPVIPRTVASAAPPASSSLTRTRPRILVSLSTNWFPGQEPTMRKLLDAVGRLDIDAVVTVGRSMDPATLPAPPNAEVVRLADHDALLPTVDLLVGHGGHGTTMRALAHGVPVLVIPSFDFTDQPVVGALVTDAGAGRMLPRRASVAALRSAIEELTGPGPHRFAAASIQHRLQATDSAAAAAAALREVAEQTRPATGPPPNQPVG